MSSVVIDTRDQLLDHATRYLKHLRGIIGKLNDNLYTQGSKALPGSTIGKHVRHILDHFSLLFVALDNIVPDIDTNGSEGNLQQPLGPVNYAHRERNPATESTVVGGQASIDRIVHIIKQMQRHSSTIPRFITIIDTLPGGSEGNFLSTVDRELWFCIHHMVHHNAIIATLMNELGLEPPTEFAYAPSTIKMAHMAENS
ncbi:hypothetical protein COEREDRAFT_80365 [Coemansia reversa NRRL 1564]|uniref:DinB-like domain-containing protein n=1 Tax=Coemansia reversa (strain ATCC 12441 / NRRL 1564) TaxID=763665 RepID=A0A2G5BF88_COERN|nr:hypothetical protein COEREDRAFT_80365 [Coemansia reversa NRRL 1564]|eukprot:PIA17679.1 hypothetical protein COEREDRAFT_80365 [Coemansia reversa NRRL 1564]